jgi:microcystin-dependent protein
MASSASDLIKFEKMATGEKSGTWGTLANVAMSRIEESIAGFRAITLAGSTYPLDDTQYLENSTTTSESHLAMIKAVGSPGASRQITVPLRTKIYLFWNAVTTYDMTVAAASGDSVTITNGNLAWVFCDGTNVELASPMFTTAGIISASGLPAASLTAVGGIEVATVAETNTGSDATRAVSPDGLDGWAGSAQVTTLGTVATGTWQGTAINQTYLTGQSGTNTGDEVASSASTAGVVELATNAETITGTDTARAVTAANVTAVLQAPGKFTGRTKGSDLASASPLVIGTTGDMHDVTGTTNFSVMTVGANRLFVLQFDGVLTVTHGSDIVLPGGANLTTAAGDVWTCFSTAANTVIVTNVATAGAAASGVPSGSIIAYGGSSAPSTWLFCDGTTGKDSVADTTLADLFSAIGTTYGGAGAADFDLPDLRGRIPLGLDNLGGSSANRMTASAADSLGGVGGAETHALTTGELASHTHGRGSGSPNNTKSNGGSPGSWVAGSTTGAGSGTAHANDQPWLAIGYIIKI